MLRHLVKWTAKLALPRHRDLVRGMLAELEAVPDPQERRRFAWGALAAIVRLTLRGLARSLVQAPSTLVRAHSGGPTMPRITTPRLLRRHIAPFLVASGSLTVLLVGRFAHSRVPRMMDQGASLADVGEFLLFSIPHAAALTIPMGVFLAVSWVFSRLGREGVLASARRERHGVRRLVAPVLGAAAMVATVTLVSNAEVLPRANARLEAALLGASASRSDRTMTLGELRGAAQSARATGGAEAARRAAAYDVEIQKKLALAAASIVLALAAAASAMRFPNGGTGLVVGASLLVFGAYWFALVGGESLADRNLVSPALAMWGANGLLLGVVLLLAWRPGSSGPKREIEGFHAALTGDDAVGRTPPSFFAQVRPLL